tara:strand:+ start:67 stop:225 length:159 start_codon:yes stop_codon:yes gene_type:complete
MDVVMTETTKEEHLREIEHAVSHLGGSIEYRTTFSNTGRQSKKIIIEYDVSS